MCGRLTLKTPPAQWAQLLLPALDFEPLLADWQPRYNIAPTQDIVVIAHRPLIGGDGDGTRLRFDRFRWGLVPSWASDLSIGSRMINARRETLQEKKSFVGPLAKRRCLVVADGYYEWQQLDAKHKQPHWISPRDGGVMQLAGLWEVNNKALGTPLATCTIITRAANDLLSPVHDRMPVILSGPAAERWMDPQVSAEEAYAQLGPVDNACLKYRPVSSYVNNARHESAQCLA